MKQSIFCLIVLLFSTIGFAKPVNENQLFRKNMINLQYLTGYYPTLKDKRYIALNKPIKQFVFKELNADMGKISIDYDILNLNHELVSFQISYQVSNLTERYFIRYFNFDLKNKKPIILQSYLTSKHIKESSVNKAINDFIKPCFNKRKQPKYCHYGDFSTILNFVDDNKQLDIKNSSGFYILNNHTIGISFDTNKFTVDFPFDIKTKKIKAW